MSNLGIKYDTTDQIRRIISDIGRSEDVKFAPDNSKFIICEYLVHKLHMFTVEFDRTDSPAGIFITGYTLITSPDIKNPHGLCFLDNDGIVVCNRSGDVSIFRLPEPVKDLNEFRINAERKISGKGYLTANVKTPGSVDCYQIDENRYRIFVCNNHWHMITLHIVELGDRVKIENEGILIENSLQIPDGITLSPDKQWIAISNHVYGQAVIYRNTPELNSNTPPSRVLDGPVCPHGIRFSPDGKRLYVADAGSQYLLIYEREDGDWGKVNNSRRTVRVIDDDTFYIGRYGSREGGVKGIDIDNSNSLLISTHKMEVIGFYDINVLNTIDHSVNKEEIAELRRQRDEAFHGKRDKRLYRQWTMGSRLQEILNNKYLQPVNYKNKLKEEFRFNYLHFRNLTSAEPLIDPSGPVLSLTSYGKRIQTVFYTIESIGLGTRKPSRIILWLDNEDKGNQLPKTLSRLMKRGLEVYYSDNLGPHKKYYPYIQQEDEFRKPLVTADDDILYPDHWLKELTDAYVKDPSVIHCFRARRIRLNNGKFIPYNDWEETNDHQPSHAHFITGVSGAIYPPEFLKYLKIQGDTFRKYCPMADDIWLTVNALRAGFKVAQISEKPVSFNTIPGTQQNGLFHYNVIAGGNHKQIIQTFTKEDILKVESSIEEEKKLVARS